ncbi:hypothetical protein JTE90_021177 [Oedothorax gibbosus]|uniref:DDE Tnp4 domain-containing protein n=1 Tax=Oedothorax gibbosus TaxID=931172 RepID=A0AAV6V6L8_9ARAC|nr:hypothetical protein JTE90_021177 [Oedothorax gibbosus]
MDRYERFELEDLDCLERIERRSRYVPEERNFDLDELDDIDFKARYRFEKDTVEEIVLKPQLDSPTSQNKALLAEEKVLLALRFFAFGDYQISLGDMQKVSQSAYSSFMCRFNTAQILGRNVVERQYGVWKRRFRCIDSKLRCRLDNAQKIIIATAVLHNIAIGKGDDYAAADDYEDDDVDSINYDQTNGGVARRNCNCGCSFHF